MNIQTNLKGEKIIHFAYVSNSKTLISLLMASRKASEIIKFYPIHTNMSELVATT